MKKAFVMRRAMTVRLNLALPIPVVKRLTIRGLMRDKVAATAPIATGGFRRRVRHPARASG